MGRGERRLSLCVIRVGGAGRAGGQTKRYIQDDRGVGFIFFRDGILRTGDGVTGHMYTGVVCQRCYTGRAVALGRLVGIGFSVTYGHQDLGMWFCDGRIWAGLSLFSVVEICRECGESGGPAFFTADRK